MSIYWLSQTHITVSTYTALWVRVCVCVCVCVRLRVYIPSDSHHSTCQYMIIWTNEFIFSPYLPSAQTHYEPLLLCWNTCVFFREHLCSLIRPGDRLSWDDGWELPSALSLWLQCEFIHVKAALGIHISAQRGLRLESRCQRTSTKDPTSCTRMLLRTVKC